MRRVRTLLISPFAAILLMIVVPLILSFIAGEHRSIAAWTFRIGWPVPWVWEQPWVYPVSLEHAFDWRTAPLALAVWFPVAYGLLWSHGSITTTLIHRRRVRIERCPVCSYSAQGLPSSTCPECGSKTGAAAVSHCYRTRRMAILCGVAGLAPLMITIMVSVAVVHSVSGHSSWSRQDQTASQCWSTGDWRSWERHIWSYRPFVPGIGEAEFTFHIGEEVLGELDDGGMEVSGQLVVTAGWPLRWLMADVPASATCRPATPGIVNDKGSIAGSAKAEIPDSFSWGRQIYQLDGVNSPAVASLDQNLTRFRFQSSTGLSPTIQWRHLCANLAVGVLLSYWLWTILFAATIRTAIERK